MAEPAYDHPFEVDDIPVTNNSTGPEVDYRPTREFQELVQEVIDRRKSFKSNIGGMIPLSKAIDNECARRGIIR